MTLLVAFSGGKAAVAGYGDRWQFMFGGTWLQRNPTAENWSVQVTSSQGDFTIGVGLLHNLKPTCGLTYRDRVYVGLQSQFNISDNDNPTGFEEQNPGAGFFDLLSQFGSQDAITGLAVCQGKLYVINSKSVQIWQVDADPNNFQLLQTLDNTGTTAALSIQQIGDLDVFIEDPTGIRSLRTREVTLNAYVDDVGSPIDEFIQLGVNSADCAVVEPVTKNYWIYNTANNLIFVLSRHPSAKISAWSSYEPRDSTGQLFVPTKFVIFNNIVYCRSAANTHLTYGNPSAKLYDTHSPISGQIPYLDDKRPGLDKSWTGFNAVLQGDWNISVSTDPQSDTYTNIYSGGSAPNPNVLKDSTFNIGRITINSIGTHISVKFTQVSTGGSSTTPGLISSMLFYYNSSETL